VSTLQKNQLFIYKGVQENLKMPLVKINWGIFSTGLFSTMIIAFEYVHCDHARWRTFL
jgi:hypothetical protein